MPRQTPRRNGLVPKVPVLRGPALALGALVAAAVLLGACGDTKVDRNSYPAGYDARDPTGSGKEAGSIFGPGGLLGGGASGANLPNGTGGGIGVNSFLWRASLDTLAFMPLASADPFGGVIITDWYQPASASGERFKATAYILGRTLRADGVRVSVFRQVMHGNNWVDAPVAPNAASELENKVLARARDLRAEQVRN